MGEERGKEKAARYRSPLFEAGLNIGLRIHASVPIIRLKKDAVLKGVEFGSPVRIETSDGETTLEMANCNFEMVADPTYCGPWLYGADYPVMIDWSGQPFPRALKARMSYCTFSYRGEP